MIIPTVYREDHLVALRSLTRHGRTDPFLRMLDRAQEFVSRVDFQDMDTALEALRATKAFSEPTEARLVIPQESDRDDEPALLDELISERPDLVDLDPMGEATAHIAARCVGARRGGERVLRRGLDPDTCVAVRGNRYWRHFPEPCMMREDACSVAGAASWPEGTGREGLFSPTRSDCHGILSMNDSGAFRTQLQTTRARGSFSFAFAAALLLAPQALVAQDVQRLTMEEAVQLAQQNSAALQALGHRVEEQEHRSAGVRANYFPQLETQFNYQRFDGGGLNLPVELGNGLFAGMTTLSQPITHLFKIREGHGVALADEDIARAELRRVRNEVALGTMKLYGGLLIATSQREAAAARVTAADARIANVRVAAASGNVLEVATAEARVDALEARRELVESESLIESYQYDLVDLVGLPPGSRIALVEPEPVTTEIRLLDEYVSLAVGEGPEVLAARATLRKAEHGVAAARTEYIPDVGFAITHFYQSAFDFFPKSSFGAGLQLNWTVVDFGKRSGLRGERRSQLAQAEANLRMVEGKVRGDVERAYRQLTHAETMVALAREANGLRAEVSRLREGQERAGLALAADARAAGAESLRGEAELVAAELGYRLAVAELLRAAGRLVGEGAR